jgi:hypothetical protein
MHGNIVNLLKRYLLISFYDSKTERGFLAKIFKSRRGM